MEKNTLLLPKIFLEKIAQFIPQGRMQPVLQSFLTEKPVSFRINTLKIPANELQQSLHSLGFLLKPLPWYSDGFLLQNKSQRELTETGFYKNGLLYIQNLSSMIPALVLDPQDGEIILDLCAAPGSKTSQIAAMMHNTGEILANDTSRTRLYRLSENIRQLGVINTKTSLFPGQALWKKFPEYFDKVLVDVPCSMEGRFRNDDPKTYKDWSPKKVKLLTNLQKYLLRSAISTTKVGGSIVYSTCTLSPEENEGVIDWILKKVGSAIAIEQITVQNLSLEPGITNWHKPFDKRVTNTSRIFPSGTMEGFFIAKLKKHASTLL